MLSRYQKVSYELWQVLIIIGKWVYEERPNGMYTNPIHCLLYRPLPLIPDLVQFVD